jgi:hypothetical protein
MGPDGTGGQFQAMGRAPGARKDPPGAGLRKNFEDFVPAIDEKQVGLQEGEKGMDRAAIGKKYPPVAGRPSALPHQAGQTVEEVFGGKNTFKIMNH